MRVALFHNRYRYRGGEDTAFDTETQLLRKAGHDVHVVTVDNRDEIAGPLGALRAGLSARWNRASVKRVDALLARHDVDVAHVHNFFPVLSPALHATLHARGVPVIQTLHNYRLLCANGMHLRAGRPCEDCVVRGPWNAVRHGCYRGSRVQTAVWADLVAHHRRVGTWTRCVSLFTTPSEFARRKLLAAGLPEDRVHVKPYPVDDPGPPAPMGEGAVFVGRLSHEKGVDLLLDAWRALPDVPLTIVGTGPDEAALRAQAQGLPKVRFTGALPHDRALAEVARAAFAVAPSRWFEIFPMSVLEALACGRAVVASDPTALSEMVTPGETGLWFDVGDALSLARACRALADDPERTRALGLAARAHYEAVLSPEKGLERLEAMYARALSLAR